ncbi:MAG: 50S ribosomal protein L6 [Vagococcus sp.]
MSRIGNRTLTIPENVNVELENGQITVKGHKGELSFNIDKNLEVKINGNEITVARNREIKKVKQMHGTTNSIIENMIIGVSEGYQKGLEIVGVGYRFNLKGNAVGINAGFSHPVELVIPSGLTVESVSNTEITIKGIDKELVGEFAATVRKIRKPEPYKGKGIRYKGEVIRRKEGKKASK